MALGCWQAVSRTRPSRCMRTLCLNVRQADRVFKMLDVQQPVFCWCRVNTDRKNLIILCYAFLDHYHVAKHNLKFCNRSAVCAIIWRLFVAALGFCVRKYRISCILSQSVRNNQFIECYLVPDHQEVVKFILKFSMLISTTDESESLYANHNASRC